MAKYRIPDSMINLEVESVKESPYNGVTFNVTREPFGYWLSRTLFSKFGKKTTGGKLIEPVLCAAYNSGMLDHIDGIDQIAARAFGSLAKVAKPKAKRKSKASTPAQ